jgi:predicted metal-dependent HD superfamily phosphohydrolase
MNRPTVFMPRNPALEKTAAGLYEAALPYHNFNHVQDTLAAGEEILSQCAAEGRNVDAQVVYYALLFHDAGYQYDHEASGFASKEALAADWASRTLRDWDDVSAETVDAVVSAINATQRDIQPSNDEQQVVRAADLMGMAADYPSFRAHTEELRQEHIILTGEEYGWDAWTRRASGVIEGYLSQHLDVTDFFRPDASGESKFQRRIRDNLRRLAEGQ